MQEGSTRSIPRSRIHVDSDRIIEQIGIVHAVVFHSLASRPFAALLSHFEKARSELFRCRLQHLHAMFRSARQIGHCDRRRFDGRRIEHERFDSDAVAPEHDPHVGRRPKTRFDSGSARLGERRACRRRSRRSDECRSIGLGARLGRSLARAQHAGHEADRGFVAQTLARTRSGGAYALDEPNHAFCTERLDTDRLTQTRALGATASPGNGRRRGGRACEAHDVQVGSGRAGVVNRPLDRGPGQPALESLIGFSQQVIPHMLVEARPSEEAPSIARKPGRQIARYARRLDDHGTVATRRIDQRCARMRDFIPSGDRQQTGSQRAFERRFRPIVGSEIRAPVQRCAR